MRIDGYASLRDYALIGDGRTCALVARDGSVDWLCAPDIDSRPVFGCILDARRGGSLRLEPVEPYEVERRYEDGSNVLETTFRTSNGVARVIDAMTLTDDKLLTPQRELVRKVEGLSGTVTLRWRFEPCFDLGARAAAVKLRNGRPFAAAGTTAVSLGVWDAGEPALEAGAASAEFSVSAGKTALVQLAVADREPMVFSTRHVVEERLRQTQEFWPRWLEKSRYNGRWAGPVRRSALVLKLLVFAPSGAIVAAPTTSLPERLGGERNWDYRFTWVRDASWTLDALLRLGFADEAHAFFWWLMHASRITQPRLQILYRVNGSAKASELDRRDVDGYRGSRPVRFGNSAADQVQLDVYGDLLDAVHLYVDHGLPLDTGTGKEIARIADYVAKIWQDPDAGIWEVRSATTHFIQSKALCWVALDRACLLAQAGAIPDRHASRWRAEADKVRAFVDEHGWDDEVGSYVRAPDQRELDASLLTLSILEFDVDGERIRRTIDAVKRELGEGPFLYRYRGEDGLVPGEGAFLTCSFWLVDALARTGRVDDACALMEELVGCANDVGLYSEEIDPTTGEFLGNFPQALTHLALVNAAITLADAEEGRR
jgi:GH15 family glucan-1,4-alpha-glucosidase